MADEQKIVKVYFLNDDQQWETLGKGNLFGHYLRGS